MPDKFRMFTQLPSQRIFQCQKRIYLYYTYLEKLSNPSNRSKALFTATVPFPDAGKLLTE